MIISDNAPYIIDCLRTPVGKAPRGTLSHSRPDDMAAAVIEALFERHPSVPKDAVEDVILGCAMPEAEQGMNVARIAGLRAGLPETASAMTINRFCSSGLQALALACDRIAAGGADCIVAGGTESMSLVPMGGHKIAPNPALVSSHPDAYLSMGLTAENLAAQFSISRQEQDQFALASHQKALRAQDEGRFSEELVPLVVAGRVFDRDEGPRRDTSLAALEALTPSFKNRGSVTAGNSSQMSDGAAAGLVVSGRALRQWNLQPAARLVAFATAGVAPEIMGIGPVEAIPKALKMAGLLLEQIDLIELNEAFAAQALAVIRKAGLTTERVNVNGGAIALGHPLGCTGAKLVATLLREMKRRKSRYGMVTMCVGGGMGAAGILENLQP
ncbi:MAG: acetyl-CoA C-acyltransferase [Acidobacteria bacterium]|nr:acetyl-CoA C-acyltransferase [Acidobacteriota bacterium]